MINAERTHQKPSLNTITDTMIDKMHKITDWIVVFCLPLSLTLSSSEKNFQQKKQEDWELVFL